MRESVTRPRSGIRVSGLGFRIESLLLGLLKVSWGQMGFRFKGWGFRRIEALGLRVKTWSLGGLGAYIP